mmetsp:Transcript_9242/g.18197  ORF Transcript_9242/g.18197 Transcript_9242/m.18197 type:complete len:216 (-) Transcript_9242:1117-1764(-)
MSKFLEPMVQRSKCTCSTVDMEITNAGVSVKFTKQCTEGCSITISRCGVPWKARSRYGMSNSRLSKPCLCATSSTFTVYSWNFLFMALRIFRSRCSDSISSGSYTLPRAPTSSDASTTSVINCTSTHFFFPTMMGCLRWKCTSTMCSDWQGWKKACFTLLYIMSTCSPVLPAVNRRPLVCASRVPLDFRPPPSAGRISMSAKRGTRMSLSFTSLA